MELFEPIDGYCERLMAGFWAEPLNAITNLAFIIAALWVWRVLLRAEVQDRSGQVLAINVGVIGVGSFLFHTFANRLTALMDVIPILSFMLIFLAVILQRLFGLGRWPVAGALIAFVVSFPVIGALVPVLNLPSSMALYLPALLVLVILGAAAFRSGQKQASISLLVTAAIFTLSLSLRTLDLPICAPGDGGIGDIGTHFLWHVLNAVVLARASALAISLRRKSD